jgi:hypothetical protein
MSVTLAAAAKASGLYPHWIKDQLHALGLRSPFTQEQIDGAVKQIEKERRERDYVYTLLRKNHQMEDQLKAAGLMGDQQSPFHLFANSFSTLIADHAKRHKLREDDLMVCHDYQDNRVMVTFTLHKTYEVEDGPQ